MPVIMPLAACGARFSGVSAKYAWLSQNTSHSAFAARAPTARAATKGAAAPGGPAGQSSTAISA
jgi:hypothetical protein